MTNVTHRKPVPRKKYPHDSFAMTDELQFNVRPLNTLENIKCLNIFSKFLHSLQNPMKLLILEYSKFVADTEN